MGRGEEGVRQLCFPFPLGRYFLGLAHPQPAVNRSLASMIFRCAIIEDAITVFLLLAGEDGRGSRSFIARMIRNAAG